MMDWLLVIIIGMEMLGLLLQLMEGVEVLQLNLELSF